MTCWHVIFLFRIERKDNNLSLSRSCTRSDLRERKEGGGLERKYLTFLSDLEARIKGREQEFTLFAREFRLSKEQCLAAQSGIVLWEQWNRERWDFSFHRDSIVIFNGTTINNNARITLKKKKRNLYIYIFFKERFFKRFLKDAFPFPSRKKLKHDSFLP